MSRIAVPVFLRLRMRKCKALGCCDDITEIGDRGLAKVRLLAVVFPAWEMVDKIRDVKYRFGLNRAGAFHTNECPQQGATTNLLGTG